MSAPASQTQWYLARDGQQFGPLTEVELAKFIELGHLQPTDLLWREGFPDWRPAMVVFPQRTQPGSRAAAGSRSSKPAVSSANAPRQPAGLDSARGDASSYPVRAATASRDDQQQERRRGGGLRRLLVATIFLGAIGAAGWFAYPHRAGLMEYVRSMAPSESFATTDRKSLETPPLAGLAGTPEAVDATLQGTALWRVIKREFPDWYAERIKEVVSLAGQSKDDAAISQHLARALVLLRRQQVNNALSASVPRLKFVASSFFDNLVELRKHSVEACYGFISQGEANPVVISLLQGSPQTARLQTLMTAVFEAIADGRKTPRVYPQPRKSDYDTLAADLTKRGWSPADMQLFSDERALARAGPDKVCQLVHDWFAAQLAIKDPDMQLRLLVDSLRPVVAG